MPVFGAPVSRRHDERRAGPPPPRPARMHTRRSWSLRLLPAVAVLAAAACSDSTAPSKPLDAVTVAAQDSSLAQVSADPALQSLIGSASLDVFSGIAPRITGTPMPSLARAGAILSLQSRGGVSAIARSVAAVAGTGSFIDSTAFGKTYVMANGQYVWDSTRTDAPANGARVVLYQRLPDGSFGTTPVGAIDFIDSTRDTVTMSGIVHIYDAQGTSVGDWRLTESQTPSSDVARIDGAIGRDGRQLFFNDTLSMSTTQSGGTTTSSVTFSLNTAAPFIGFAYHLRISNLDTGSGAPGQLDLRMTLARHQVEVTGAFPPDSADTLHLAVDGTPTAIYTQTAGLRAPDGSAPSPEVAELASSIISVANRVPTGLVIEMVLSNIASQLH